MSQPEVDLASKVVAWLERRGWTVYQEVAGQVGRADIVAVRGPLLYVVECKVSFGFAVVDQAMRWLGHANMVSVAASAWSGRERACDRICELLGLGRLSVDVGVTERVAPAIHRRADSAVRGALRPEHRDYAVAGSNGGYFSQWRGTCARLREVVEKHYRDVGCGLDVKAAVEKIAHHYATDKSARACLLRGAEAGEVDGVRVEVSSWTGKKAFVPAEAKKLDGPPQLRLE